MAGKWIFFGVVVVVGIALDYWTKQLALAHLDFGVTQWKGPLLLTLSYNRGAAFGLNLGAASRPIFIVFTVVTVLWLSMVYQKTETRHSWRRLGIVLVCAGALGNLIDRVSSAEGVVDFLGPYNLGFMLWPIFNVADILVVAGILALLISLRSSGLRDTVVDAVQ